MDQQTILDKRDWQTSINIRMRKMHIVQLLLMKSKNFMLPSRVHFSLLTSCGINTLSLLLKILGPVCTWKEGAPANRATRLEGLKHCPPLHATHLTGTVSGPRKLSLERPLSTTNITADQGSFFPSYFSFLHRQGPVLCLRLVYCIDLFRLTVNLFGR